MKIKIFELPPPTSRSKALGFLCPKETAYEISQQNKGIRPGDWGLVVDGKPSV